jgi:lysophospholipase L1-like esterase
VPRALCRRSVGLSRFALLSVLTLSLPFVARTDSLPADKAAPVPLQLDVGPGRADTYMAFGDSITDGKGSSDTLGYRVRLQRRLEAHFGVATVVNEGVPGTRTGRGLERIGEALAEHRPAYTLILYGTNDWNKAACKHDDDCPTVENLTAIVRAVRAAGSLPVLGTIIPANPAPAYSVKNPPSRNAWIDQTNTSLRLMAQNEGVLVADLHAAFMAYGDLVPLFSDHVHPSDLGYEVIATEFLRVITDNTTMTAAPIVAPTSASAAPKHMASPDSRSRADVIAARCIRDASDGRLRFIPRFIQAKTSHRQTR